MSGYKRQVITMLPEWGSAGSSKKMIGTCIIEKKGQNGKIMLNLSGLDTLKVYKFYLISVENGRSQYFFVSRIPVCPKGKGEFKAEFHAMDVFDSQIGLEQFSVAALAEEKNKALNFIMSGLLGAQVDWKKDVVFVEKAGKGARREEAAAIEIKEQIIQKQEVCPEIEIKKPVQYEEIPEKHVEPPVQYEEMAEEYAEEPPVQYEEMPGEYAEELPVQYEAMPEKYVEEPPVRYEEMSKEYVKEPPVQYEEMPEKYDDPPVQYEKMPEKYEKPLKESKPVSETKQDGDDFLFSKLRAFMSGSAPEGHVYQEVKEPEAYAQTDTHETFKAVAKKFNEELEALKNLQFNASAVPLDDSTKQKIDKRRDLSRIFANNPSMNPFKRQNKDVFWVRSNPQELQCLPYGFDKYATNELVLSCYKNFNHLLLGRFYTDLSVRYIVALPDNYSAEKAVHAKYEGFSQFKCCDGEHPAENAYGYWLVII